MKTAIILLALAALAFTPALASAFGGACGFKGSTHTVADLEGTADDAASQATATAEEESSVEPSALVAESLPSPDEAPVTEDR